MNGTTLLGISAFYHDSAACLVRDGEVTIDANKKLLDLNTREKVILAAILVFIVWIGVHPTTFLDVSENSVRMVLTRLGGG
ncbi:hypothetical protein HQ587_03775 [bacterium]|nr:hypothetical protein [bacterium]